MRGLAPAALVSAAFLAGCMSTQRNEIQANPEAMAPLTCSGKEECDRYWQRAQAWIALNSAYKIQTQSDATLQTHGPINSRVELAYTITRVPEANGSARILIAPSCGNIFGCSPNPAEAIVSFKRYVKG